MISYMGRNVSIRPISSENFDTREIKSLNVDVIFSRSSCVAFDISCNSFFVFSAVDLMNSFDDNSVLEIEFIAFFPNSSKYLSVIFFISSIEDSNLIFSLVSVFTLDFRFAISFSSV